MIEVFVSRPTWVDPEFIPGLDGFLTFLKSLEINPRTLGATDYPSKAPVDEVITLMEQCVGAVILGYPQIKITVGAIRNKPIQEEFYLPTEWNHIEAGLAYARKLPLLVIHHLKVRRGIFDRGAISGFLYERDLSQASWPLAVDLQGAIVKWKKDCLLPLKAKVNNTSLTAEKSRLDMIEHMGVLWKRTATGFEEHPYCRECQSHPIMMPTPPSRPMFWMCANGDHQAPLSIVPPA